MRASTKTTAYLKRMISLQRWQDKLPSVNKIAKVLKVSDGTVRKGIRILEEQRIVENNGGLGFTIIPKKFEQLYKVNKQLYYLAMLERNLRIANLLKDGGRIFDNFVILRRGEQLLVGDTASGDVIKTTISEVSNTMYNPINLQSVLSMPNDSELSKYRAKYLRQKRISKASNVILNHRRELGL